MSRPVSRTLAVPVAVGVGAALDVSHLYAQDFFVSIAGTFVGTYQIEYSTDGTVFTQEGADITAVAQRTVAKRVKLIRVRCTAYTSGTPSGTLFGHETVGADS